MPIYGSVRKHTPAACAAPVLRDLQFAKLDHPVFFIFDQLSYEH